MKFFLIHHPIAPEQGFLSQASELVEIKRRFGTAARYQELTEEDYVAFRALGFDEL